MSEKPETFNPFDPTGMFKVVRDTYMESWSKMMIQLVNTEAYAQSTGAMLDAWLKPTPMIGFAPFSARNWMMLVEPDSPR